MDVQFTDAVILGFAFWVGAVTAGILLSQRYKKKRMALKRSVDKFAEEAYRDMALRNGDNREILEKLEAGDSESAKQVVSFGIALFYHYEGLSGFSKHFDAERRKIDELAKSSAILAAEIEKVSEMKASRLTPRWSQRPLRFELSDDPMTFESPNGERSHDSSGRGSALDR